MEQCNCDLIITDVKKITPLHIATANGYLEIIQYFTKTCHCNLVRDEDDRTPLEYAIITGQTDIVSCFF